MFKAVKIGVAVKNQQCLDSYTLQSPTFFF